MTVIDSTNRRATEWARHDAPDGALVLAEEQTAGRGRLGRRWHAPAGSALLMSLVLRPTLDPAQAQRATMICSLGAVDAARQVAGLSVQVKWPNDLVIDGRKVGRHPHGARRRGQGTDACRRRPGDQREPGRVAASGGHGPRHEPDGRGRCAPYPAWRCCAACWRGSKDGIWPCSRVGHRTKSGARIYPPWAQRCVWAHPTRSSKAMPSMWIPTAPSSCRAQTADGTAYWQAM